MSRGNESYNPVKPKNGNGHRLTPKQAAFVEEYLVDLNASAAYRRAGYAGNNADVNGPRLLGNDRIAEAIAKGQEERRQRTHATQDDVVRILTREAEGQGQDTNSSARVQAAQWLGKHHGMFIERVEDVTPQRVDKVQIEFVKP